MKLLCLADSWMKYPKLFKKSNIARWLSVNHDVTNLSKNGREAIESLVGDNKEKLMDKLSEEYFDAIVFSGFGNEIAGKYDLRFYLDDGKVNEVKFNNKLQAVKCTLIEFIQRLEVSKNKSIPIVTHTYDYARPSGVGYKMFGWTLVKPWLKPYFDKEGIHEESKQLKIIKDLLERYRDMLLTIQDEYPNFYVVDTLGTVNIDEWQDELHLTENGFKKVTDKIEWKLKEVV